MKIRYALLASSLFLSACSDIPEDVNNITQIQSVSPPPSLAERPDFASMTNVNDKKTAFTQYLKPSINYLNGVIEQARTRLTALEKQLSHGNSISEDDAQFLLRVSQLFTLPLPESSVDEAWFKEALQRVDVIPADLVLSQAANESGWGTSRFAVQGNNYFGQWCYTTGCGMVPSSRTEGMKHEVAKFENVYESIRAYFLNVNRNSAYQELRDTRYQLREAGHEITGEQLALGLHRYSERGLDYIEEIQSMIRFNQKFWSQG